jgi:hypothetical protein
MGIAEEEAIQLRDEYLKDLDPKKDADLITEIKSIKIWDHEAFKKVFDGISERDDKYKKSMAELQHLRDLRKIAQDDKANRDVWIVEMKALGREHPHFAGKVAELETKYRKSGGLENALRGLLTAEKKEFELAKKNRDQIYKEYSAFGDQVSQFMKEKEEYSEALKDYLREHEYLDDNERQKVDYNDFDQNLKLVKTVHNAAMRDRRYLFNRCKEKLDKTRDMVEHAEKYRNYSDKLDKYTQKIKTRMEEMDEEMANEPSYDNEDEEWDNEEDDDGY